MDPNGLKQLTPERYIFQLPQQVTIRSHERKPKTKKLAAQEIEREKFCDDQISEMPDKPLLGQLPKMKP